MTNKQGITTLLLLATGVIWVFFVSMYGAALAWYNQSYSVFYMILALPGIGLMLYSLFYIKRINHNGKKTKFRHLH